MKIQCGTDIIEVNRIQEAINSLGENFLQKVYTKSEIEYCNSKKQMKYQHFAARFAAKEAIFKAISNSTQNKYYLVWNDVEIINNENGKPIVNFTNDKIKNKIESIDISLSHIKEYAISNCIAVLKEE